MFDMSRHLASPEDRMCEDCSSPFTTNWPQRLCNPCRYDRAARSVCVTCGGKTGQSGREMCGNCRYGPVPELLAMTAADRGWLSGILEGEGYVGVVHQHGTIRVAMTDGDVIRRAYDVSGVGRVNELPRRAPHHKIVFTWSVVRHASIPDVLLAMAPLLGERRRIQAAAVLRLHDTDLPPPQTLVPGSEEAWGWISGLVEGEGCFEPGPLAKKRKGLAVAVDSTDPDVVERLAMLTGAGTLTNLGSRQANWKTRYRWRVTKKAEVQMILSRILPRLGERRAGQASYVLGQI